MWVGIFDVIVVIVMDVVIDVDVDIDVFIDVELRTNPFFIFISLYFMFYVFFDLWFPPSSLWQEATVSKIPSNP